MSGTGEVRADFGGEERPFRIRLGEIRRIEAACGTGIGEVARRLARATGLLAQAAGLPAVQVLAAGVDIHADDVREPIYRGLIGGGMSDPDATKLVREAIDERGLVGLLDHASTALTVLLGAQETPDTGERQAGESPAMSASGSTSASSSASAPPSASRPARSKPARRGSSSPPSTGGSAPTGSTTA